MPFEIKKLHQFKAVLDESDYRFHIVFIGLSLIASAGIGILSVPLLAHYLANVLALLNDPMIIGIGLIAGALVTRPYLLIACLVVLAFIISLYIDPLRDQWLDGYLPLTELPFLRFYTMLFCAVITHAIRTRITR